MALSATPAELAAAMNLAAVPVSHWLVVAPVVLPLAGGAALVALRHRFSGQKGLIPMLAIALLVLTVAANAGLLSLVLAGGPLTMVMGRWLPPFGIAFTVDVLGAAMALAASLATLMASILALGEGAPPAPAYRPQPFHLLLLAGVSGAFLTGDIFNLYVWFEVLLISSFGLLSLGSGRAEIDGTLKYGFLNLIGTTLFLIAVGLIYGLTGTLNMADLATRLPALQGAPLTALSALFLFAFAMKAAAFPLQAWLPAAYHTPRASTAGLFAALLTKVGIYAILRVLGMLLTGPLESLSLLVAVVAAATMLFGALGTLAERNLKRLPGFVLISGIGTMLAGIALNSPGGSTGTIFYALQSMGLMLALYAALFEAARLGGEADIARGGGLHGRHPLLSFAILSLLFAASGLPPFSGFWPKALILKAALDIGAWWLAGALLVSGFLMTIGLTRAYMIGFWRPAAKAGHPAAERASGPVTGVVLVLALAIAAAGLYPEPLLDLSGRAAAGLADPAAYVQSVFPGGQP